MAPMGTILIWIVANAATTIINTAMLGYLAWRGSNSMHRWWSGAWLMATFTVLFSSPNPSSDFLFPVGIGFAVVTSMLFLTGAYRREGHRLPRAWLGALAIALVIALGFVVQGNPMQGLLPLVFLYAGGVATTGALMLKGAQRRVGGWITGSCLLLLALHILSYPLLALDPSVAPWGFLIAILLEVLIGFGTVMLHYEETHERWAQTSEDLEHARRTEALGRVAGGVAHNFNNMLAIMQGHLDLMRLEGLSASGSTDAMQNAVDKATRLTTQLLAFGRRSVVQVEVVELREVIEGTLELLRRVTPTNIALHFSADVSTHHAMVDRTLLEQIVLNLVSNASDALPHGGHVYARLQTLDASSGGVLLEIADDGVGMKSEALEHIFDPFYTTKAPGQGTGLGLASVQGAVKQMGGEIHVESTLGEGTTFKVCLPVEVIAASENLADTPSLEAHGRALVVDDDDKVRTITAKLLSEAGHHVQQAIDGEQALALLDVESFDVVFSDVMMPGLSGVELMECVHAKHPHVEVVLMSGYAADKAIDTQAVRFLAKPFSREKLLRCFEDILSQRSD